jgi:ryanodine receptor 2
MIYADIMSNSCVIIDDDEEEEGGGESKEEDENIDSFQESEMQKQKLLYEQNRLADRGAAEMALLYISASKGEKSEMLEKTLHLGISLLHGGNVSVQQKMLDHLMKKKDVGFFTSLAGLMANCSVLDLDTFERCIKAEQFGGVSSTDSGSGMAGKKNLHDAEFTCSLFRFLQLLCEGHNLDFQNYLRVQTGNNTIINTIVCTVDYLLRLQESIMDFYWHYSGKSTVDKAGKENFVKAITIAKQVFNSLTEFIQGPCVGNQLTLAHSRLWDAIGGFLYIFANLQDKLSKDPHQIELLRELMTLQKDMIIMLLSMLEGNVLNGPIGKQMVDTLIENQQNVEMLLKFFDIFLKMKDLTTSDAFQEFDSNGDGWISPKEFKKAMEAQKMYSSEEIDYVLRCVDTNQDGKIDFKEFTERFHNPAKDIGFNMAVLLTNLSEHMSYDPRFDKLMKKASSFLNYFEPYLGRIEIAGSSGRIERVYFEITESNIEQWNKPQIRDSKKQFLYDIVNEGDEKEKLENFVNFCEDTIFEMEHAESISSFEQEEEGGPVISETNKTSYFRSFIDNSKYYIISFIHLLSPYRIKENLNSYKDMKKHELFKLFASFSVNVLFFIFSLLFNLVTLFFRCIYLMILGSNTRDVQRLNQPEIADSNLQARLRKSHSTQDHTVIEEELKAKPFGMGLGGMSDVQENLDTKEVTSELEIYDELTPLRVPESSTQKQKPAEKAPITYEEAEEDVLKATENQTASASSSKSKYKKILSILAKNYYKMKYLALALAFVINILMMSYKAIALTDETAALDANSLLEEDGETAEETNLIEVIMMDPEDNYIEQIIKVLAIFHSSIAFGIMIAYYILKVPLVLFKREKEIARKLEFEGLWIAEQPSDDDLRSHWDKLVISTRTYPGIYWDKFVKKKVKNKYAEQFELEQLCKLLGISSKADEYTSDDSKDAGKQPETGLWSRLNFLSINTFLISSPIFDFFQINF